MKVEDARVGMRVRYIGEECDYGPKSKQTGTIMSVSDEDDEVSVEFDKPFPEGHKCAGECKNKCGYWFYPPNDACTQNDNLDNIILEYKWKKL